MRFQVGDIIVGKPGSSQHYDVTNEYGRYKVIQVNDNNIIYVQVLSHTMRVGVVGRKFGVNAKFFMLDHQNAKCEYTQSLSAMFD